MENNINKIPFAKLPEPFEEFMRSKNLKVKDIKILLRTSQFSFVLVEIGLPIKVVSGLNRYDLWKDEIACRLAETDAFYLDDFPNEYC